MKRSKDFDGLGPPTERNMRSVKTWLRIERPLCEEELTLLREAGDFVAIAATDEGPFDTYMGKLLGLLPPNVSRHHLL